MQTAWIIGAGTFGYMAAKKLNTEYRIVLVDTDAECLDKITLSDIEKVHDDGVKYLAENLDEKSEVSWIVPCLPMHLAWEWCREKIGPAGLVPNEPPLELDRLLPHPMRTPGPHIYVSHADFVCPAHCSEPDARCTVTRQPRKPDMDGLLESVSVQGFRPAVLKSRQLAPGVGGYRPKDLFTLLKQVKTATKDLLICTACRCHGVVTGAVYNASKEAGEHGTKAGK